MKTVVFASNSCLPCACDPENVVVLCLDPSTLVAASNSSTIEAHMTQTYKSQNSCCGTVPLLYNYVFEYDEAQLSDPTTALTTAQVVGAFCKGCITTWIEELVANAIGGGE